MGYLKIEGGKKSGLRPDEEEDLALIQGAPRILLRSKVPILQPFCQRKVATINNLLGSQLHCLDTSREAVGAQNRQCRPTPPSPALQKFLHLPPDLVPQ